MPQEKITAVSIPVQDQQAAKAFYMEKLGFELAVGERLGAGADAGV